MNGMPKSGGVQSRAGDKRAPVFGFPKQGRKLTCPILRIRKADVVGNDEERRQRWGQIFGGEVFGKGKAGKSLPPKSCSPDTSKSEKKDWRRPTTRKNRGGHKLLAALPGGVGVVNQQSNETA